jgi:hypothetical protein
MRRNRAHDYSSIYKLLIPNVLGSLVAACTDQHRFELTKDRLRPIARQSYNNMATMPCQ